MDPNRRRLISGTRDGVVLGVALLLALTSLVPPIRVRGWEEQPDLPAAVDASMAVLRSQLRPGERLAVAVPPLDEPSEMAFWYAAQYGAAPALVEPIMVRECISDPPGPRCRLGGAARVAVPGADPFTVALLQRRLGIVPVGAAGPTILLARSGP